ncbi:MAG: hypothetical protein EOL92_09215 [Bacteroidia bacterium]|nr:hypothetical protein [Bacteroidia bacterium]
MQNGLIFVGALLGKSHIKWGAKADRKEGEMLNLYICPKANGTSLDVKPEEVMVPADAISSVEARLSAMKQFDTVFLSVDKQRERLVFKSFVELK